MRDCAPATDTMRRPEIALSSAPMSPGTYLRLRREAAGLEREYAAKLIAGSAEEAETRAAQLEAVENDEAGPFNAELILKLWSAFAFVPDIYTVLFGFQLDPESELPCPRICTRCGCSWTDPCSPICHWSKLPGDICSNCAGDA